MRDGIPVVAHVAADERDVRGINDRAQLAAVERELQARRAQALMVRGVSLADPARIDIRGTLACGRDVRIDVGCVFEGDVTLGDDVTIGPYCVLRDVTVGAGTRDRGVLAPRRTRRSAPTAASAPTRGCARARRSPRTSTSATSSR